MIKNKIFNDNINYQIELNTDIYHENKYLNNEYDIEENLYKSILVNIKDPICFDCGSNIGYMSILFISLGAKEVYTFEPVLDIYNKLVDNTKNYKNIKNYNFAVSNNNNIDTITLSISHNQGNTLSSRIIEKFPTVFSEIKTENIKKIKLTDFIKNNNIIKIDLLKLDIENHEYEALLGLEESISIVDTIVYESFFEDVQNQIELFLIKNNFIITRMNKGINNSIFIAKNNR